MRRIYGGRERRRREIRFVQYLKMTARREPRSTQGLLGLAVLAEWH